VASTVPAPPTRAAAPGSARALTWEIHDGIAVVVLDLKGQPVNVISRAVKDEFLSGFALLEADTDVRAIAFLSGKPDNFIAGADIEEFVQLRSAAEAERLAAEGQEMLDRIASFPKPIAVGIHGSCLGGGFEFALACHYRVASDHDKTQIGLPEIQLGILPAAGGCQRLPRLVGARAALDMILAGKSERAAKAFRLGMVDELVPQAILADITIAAARRMAGAWRPKRKRRGGVGGWLLDGNALGRRLVFRTARKQVLAKTGGHYPAPLAALDAVEHGLRHGMAAGLRREAQLFGQLAVTDVSRKLVQIFFATNQLKKDSGVAGAPPPARVTRLGIIGAGFMGAGIAGTAVAQAQVDVRMKDADLARVAQGLRAAREILDDRLTRRRITKFDHARLVALLSGGDSYAGFGRAELVIEAVFEDLAVKRTVLQEAEAALPDGAVFASNTSTIPITSIAEAARRPEQVIGMHFFSPVAKMPLLEVIPGARTAPGAVSTAVAFGRRMGKTVIVVKDSPGFWVNRILAPYANEIGHLLAEGASIDDIDGMAVRFGFPVGPVTLLDEVGLDVAEKVAKVMQAAYGDRIQPHAGPGVADLVKAGRMGRKSGRGFYAYHGGKKRGVDESVYRLLGVQPNGGPRPAEILQRLTLGMVNEAARALGEGVVRNPRDGDIGAIFGFGFPPFRGGPLRYADDLGAARVVADLERLAERFGSRFAPSEVLQEHARRETKFYS
jgi:3-hydroxyacyl-CoA dehydrogenase/enoyl-CoA hydratase/3-hydroxybutyryl-CoA epimerase